MTWPAQLALVAAAFLVAVAAIGLVDGRGGRVGLALVLVGAGVVLVVIARRREDP